MWPKSCIVYSELPPLNHDVTYSKLYEENIGDNKVSVKHTLIMAFYEVQLRSNFHIFIISSFRIDATWCHTECKGLNKCHKVQNVVFKQLRFWPSAQHSLADFETSPLKVVYYLFIWMAY